MKKKQIEPAEQIRYMPLSAPYIPDKEAEALDVCCQQFFRLGPEAKDRLLAYLTDRFKGWPR